MTISSVAMIKILFSIEKANPHSVVMRIKLDLRNLNRASHRKWNLLLFVLLLHLLVLKHLHTFLKNPYSASSNAL